MPGEKQRLTEQELAVCEAIRVAIKAKKGATIRGVAQAVGLSEDVLGNIGRGITPADPDLVDRIRKELKLPKQWPHEPVHTSQGSRISLAGTPMAPLKIVGIAHAGAGFPNVDYDEKVIYVPERLANVADYAWLTEGDSMMPFMEPGDVAAFTESRTPRRGFIFLLQKEGEMRVKRLDWTDGRWTMKSLNPNYTDEQIDHWQILGMLVGVYRYQGSRETIIIDVAGLRPE